MVYPLNQKPLYFLGVCKETIKKVAAIYHSPRPC